MRLSDFLRSLAAKEGQQPWTWSIKDWHLGTLGAPLAPVSALMLRFPPLMLALWDIRVMNSFCFWSSEGVCQYRQKRRLLGPCAKVVEASCAGRSALSAFFRVCIAFAMHTTYCELKIDTNFRLATHGNPLPRLVPEAAAAAVRSGGFL